MSRKLMASVLAAGCLALTACGGGGSSNENDNPSLANASSTQGSLTVARSVFRQLSWTTTTALYPSRYLQVGSHSWFCIGTSNFLDVSHQTSTGTQLPEFASYSSGDKLLMSSAAPCSDGAFYNRSGNFNVDVTSASGVSGSPPFDATLSAMVSATFDASSNTPASRVRSDTVSPLTLVIHETTDGRTIRLTGADYRQGWTSGITYPAFRIANLDLTASNTNGQVGTQVQGQFNYTDENNQIVGGRVDTSIPLLFNASLNGATSGSVTITLADGGSIVMLFSGAGRGQVKVTATSKAGQASTEVYNGSVSDLVDAI